MEYLQNIKCEVCGNTNPEKFSVTHNRKDFKVVECSDCHFSFIPQFYRQQIPYENYRDEDVLASVRRGNNWIKIKRHKLRLKFIKKFAKTGSLYDIGVGWGHFLYTAKLMGYQVGGVEISELMHHYATSDLELPIAHANFLTLDIAPKSWDIATMWDVLEHIDCPNEAVKKANYILKDGGFFILQVPQIDSWVAKKQKENWSMMSIEHINYFSKQSIKTLLDENGFEVLKYKSSYELKLFLMFTVLPWLKRKKTKAKTEGSNNGEKPEISNSERQNFFNKVTKLPHWIIVIAIFYHDIIYKMLSMFNIGEEMIVVAKKIK